MDVRRVTALATPDGPAQCELATVRPVLTAVTADFIMRCHIANWYSPGGQHSGGWCACLVKRNKRYVGGYIPSRPEGGARQARKQYLTQPWLEAHPELRVHGPEDHARRHTGHADLLLSEAQLDAMGEQAAQLTRAVEMSVDADTPEERALLARPSHASRLAIEAVLATSHMDAAHDRA